MTNKVELNTLTQVVHKEQAFLTALNENFLRLQQAINDTISRSGVEPNQMEEVLDMNGKRIVNVGAAVEDTDALTKQFIQGLIADVEAAVARLNTLVNDAKTELELYCSEYVLPPAIAARDAAEGFASAAHSSYLDTKALYDELAGLAQNLNALLAIYADISKLNAIYSHLSDIEALADDEVIADLHTCAENISAIMLAPIWAANAQTWAEGSDTDVEYLGGTHSAKKWAELSQADVAAEALTRQTADTGLQNQIDAIVASSDVKDIVGTYTDLLNYDTSSLGNNDIIKVLSDSTHSDASSYYKWVITGGVGAWNYIGSEGPYLTPSAASSTYVPKTTTINSKALSGNITLDASDVGAATAAQGSKADSALQATDIVSSVDASSTNAKAVGAKLFYDTCGDIETLINAL